MKNFIKHGTTLKFTAGADIASGAGVLLGPVLGVSATDVANGEEGEAQIEGVFSLPKLQTDDVAAFDNLYWDNTNGHLTKTELDNTYAGFATKAAGTSATTVEVRLVPTLVPAATS